MCLYFFKMENVILICHVIYLSISGCLVSVDEVAELINSLAVM